MDIFFIIALVITSIVAVTFIVERGLALRWVKVIPPDVVYSIQNYRGDNQLQGLRNACQSNPSTLSRLLLFITEHLDWPKTETVDVLETRARHEVTRLERGLVVLEIIVGIAPLLGLVGTIYGLITLFGHMDPAGMQEQGKFAQGISLALNATLLGLLIAIPALVAWSYYSKKVETLSVEMESLCDEFLRKHYRQDERPATQPIGASRHQTSERGVPLSASALPTPKPSAQS
jgi:biopolymer transport protein ExbB